MNASLFSNSAVDHLLPGVPVRKIAVEAQPGKRLTKPTVRRMSWKIVGGASRDTAAARAVRARANNDSMRRAASSSLSSPQPTCSVRHSCPASARRRRSSPPPPACSIAPTPAMRSPARRHALRSSSPGLKNCTPSKPAPAIALSCASNSPRGELAAVGSTACPGSCNSAASARRPRAVVEIREARQGRPLHRGLLLERARRCGPWSCPARPRPSESPKRLSPTSLIALVGDLRERRVARMVRPCTGRWPAL